MFNWLFGKKSDRHLGIDLGTYAIKIVELAEKDGRLALINYALVQSGEKSPVKLNELKTEILGQILKNAISQAKFESKKASLSLPLERTFSTIMSLPVMPEKELAAAIPFEAQKYIPVPLEEVVLNWSLIPVLAESKNQAASPQKIETTVAPAMVQVLLEAVPKEIIDGFAKLAKLIGIEIVALEQESFSLTRSLVGNDNGIYMIVDIGRQNTDLIVVDQSIVRISHSLDTVSKETVLMEIDRIASIYQMRYNKKVSQCLLTGGRVNEKEIFEYLIMKLKIPVMLGDPFARIGRASELEPILKELGPQLSVAMGLAMREN